VTIRDLQRVAGLIDAVISATGDTGRIHSLSYRFADDVELRCRARDEAFADARRKAEQASTADVTVVFQTSNPGSTRMHRPAP
jgi:uncharacterized protein YggE